MLKTCKYNTIICFKLNRVKLFLSLNDKTSQLNEKPALAIDTEHLLLIQQYILKQKCHKLQFNFRIIQEYFQPKIGRKIRIFSLSRKKKQSYKKG